MKRTRLGLVLASLFFCLPGCSGVRNVAPHNSLASSASTNKSKRLDDQNKLGVRAAMALNEERNGNFDAAIEIYQSILEIDNSRAGEYHRMALINDKRGRCKEATVLYLAALKRAPEQPEIHADLGYNYYLQEQWEPADHHLRRAIQLKPDFARAHNNLAMLLATNGRYDEALREFQAARLSEGEARANLSFAMLQRGDLKSAAQQLAQAASNPSHQPQRIQQLQSSLHGIVAKSRMGASQQAIQAVSLEQPVRPTAAPR